MVNAKLYLLSVWNHTIPFDPKTMKHEGSRPPNISQIWVIHVITVMMVSSTQNKVGKVPHHSAGKFQSILSYSERCTTTEKYGYVTWEGEATKQT